MWLVDKEDSIYFPNSIFLGLNSQEKFFIFLENFSNKELIVNMFGFKNNSLTFISNDYKVKYNTAHNVIVAKDMFKVSQQIKNSLNIDLYYYPKTIIFNKNIEIIKFLEDDSIWKIS